MNELTSQSMLPEGGTMYLVDGRKSNPDFGRTTREGVR